uniref:Uncharacterized protein n=1 Tax=Chromera velia CCMP2878 TaxID=1169474 RepID=A0A0G4IFQ1_9ALVE|eukprot:Cvel_14101.t1-p1 / transcript=Cvel_14101.t1 / gene=Cvel_14101 / organism=Chromera_velia_CCMP2878 / gene_product=hypothetical protein / transcript_product=hypothetical protein / location=Cvel_scaffold991:46493-49576(-) / protein_length=812 / sequence_SO=supercontig / SO=protein_coding / is_pseudo=false
MASRKVKSAWTEADQQTLTEQNDTPAADGQSVDYDVYHIKIKLKNAFHLHKFYHTKETVIQKLKGDGEGGEGKEKGKDDAEMGGVEERDDGDKVMDDSETQAIITIHGHCSTDKHKAGLAAKKSGKKQKTLSQAWGAPVSVKKKSRSEQPDSTAASASASASASAPASASASASAAASSAKSAPSQSFGPPPCLGIQYLSSSNNPSFFIIEEQAAYFTLALKYSKDGELSQFEGKVSTMGILKGLTSLHTVRCANEGSTRTYQLVSSSRIGDNRLEAAGLQAGAQFRWTQCHSCYDKNKNMTFAKSPMGLKKPWLKKIQTVEDICKRGVYTHEKELHVLNMKLAWREEDGTLSNEERAEIVKRITELQPLHEANSGMKGNAAKAVNPEKWGELEKRVKNFKDRRTDVERLKLLDFLEIDDFMKKVIPLYKEGKLDGTPWLDLSRAFVNRYLGWKNTPLGEQGSALVHALCLTRGKAVRNNLSTYLVGISERWWRRLKSKYKGGAENIYDIEPPDLAKHLETGMKRAPAARRKDGKYGATLCMDGTKITRKHVYYLRVCQWIGGCYPKQCLSGEDYNPSRNPLQINELAEYITTRLLVLHDVRLTVIVLGAKLYKEPLLNDEGKFRDDLIECVFNYPSIKLLNVCFDGDTVQGPWVVKHIEKFLSGEISYIASSCTPHVGKCIHRAVVMGSCLLSISLFPIDAGLFPFLPSVPVHVWRPKDHTSDFMTWLFSSPAAIKAVAEYENIYPFMKAGVLFIQIALRINCHLSLSNKGLDRTSQNAAKENVRARWISGTLTESVEGYVEKRRHDVSME